MSQLEADIQDLEASIEDSTAKVEKYRALQRLTQNKDFKDLIDVGYFKDYALHLVEVRVNAIAEQRDHIDMQLDAVSNLNEYFRIIRVAGRQAETSLVSSREELDMAMSEMEEN